MPVIFSPITDTEIDGPFEPRPRCAFIMLQANVGISKLEVGINKTVRRFLKGKQFDAVDATDIGGTKDYLDKIIQTIRGCGFGVAIFSQYTPASTLANIFFEVGLCSVFGKSVVLVKDEDSKTPSDFVRTEYLSVVYGDNNKFRKDFYKKLDTIIALSPFYLKIARVALEADEPDYEMAFERLKQSVLIAHNEDAIKEIQEIKDRLNLSSGEKETLSAGRNRLLRSVREFLALLPE